MKSFDQKAFNSFIIENHVIGFFEKPITLKSGKQSHWYVNWRTVSNDAFLLDKLSEFVIAFTKDLSLKPDCFYGVPEGATKLGVVTQLNWGKQASSFSKGSHVLSMGRAKPKEHGSPTDRNFVGAPRGNTIILEDVTTTGGSLLNTVDALNEIEIPIIAALGLSNRGSSEVRELLAEKNVNYYQLSNAHELLPEIIRLENPAKEIKESIENELNQ